MIARFTALLTLSLIGAAAHAAAPTATIAPSSTPVSFAEYASNTVVGSGLINTNTLFFINEKSGALGDSWLMFFEPRRVESLTATITFASAITAIFTTQADLAGSSAYESSAFSYSYASPFVGLEPRTDSYSFSGNTLTLTFAANNPGDHIRVITAPVPEPTTYALMAAGLLAVGFAAKRRSNQS